MARPHVEAQASAREARGRRRSTDEAWRLAVTAGQALIGDRKRAVTVAQHYRRLRSRGVTVDKTVDLIIGTWCIDSGCPLLYSDRDFEPMVAHLGLMAYPPRPD